jgi:type II secretory pathway component GspD/PulD (secretin)
VLRIHSIRLCALGLLFVTGSGVTWSQEAAPALPQAQESPKTIPTTESKAEPKAADDKKPAAPASQASVVDPATGERKRKLTFVYTPWKDVIDELAEWADLDIIAEKYPPGSCFHRVVDKEYTAQEAIDALNGQLLLKGFTMIVMERKLIVRDLADPIPDDFIPKFEPEELDKLGNYRLAKCAFTFTRFTPQQLEAELRPILSGWAKMQVLPTLRRVIVTETAENLRKIRDMLADDVALSNFKVIPLKSIPPDEALVLIRVLMRFPVGQDAAADGSLSLAADPGGMRLLATGNPEKIKQLEDLIKVLDPATGANPTDAEMPYMEVYPITSADPVACMKVLETQLVGEPGVRIGLDTTSDMIFVKGTANAHKIAKEALDKLQGLTLDFDVINLKRMSVEEALSILNTQLQGADGTKKGPTISGNAATQQLYVRGTSVQLAAVRGILSKLDVMSDAKDIKASGSTVRTIPLSGRALDRALDQVKIQWGLEKRNRINVVYPEGMKKPDGIRSTTPAGGGEGEKAADPDNRSTGTERLPTPKSSGKITSRTKVAPFRLASWQENSQQSPQLDDKPEVTITVLPNGNVILYSEDTEALDELEDLLMAIQNQQRSAVDDFTVIYLKHSKAEVTSELLREIIGGVDAVSGGGGGGLLGNMMQGALGQTAGNMMSGLMSGGGGGEPSAVITAGPVTIVPDTRLNALFVQAAPIDLDLVEQLVTVLDQQDGPQEPLLSGQPRTIPLAFAKAEDVATTIKAALPPDLFAGAQQSQNQQPNPAEFLRLLQGGGGRGGRGGNNQQRQAERPKITIGTNVKNNWLIVTAPDNLFKQVQELAIELDAGAQGDSQQSIQVYHPKYANGSTLKNGVATVLGIRTSTTGVTGTTNTTTAPNTTASTEDDAVRRARERFQQGGGFPGGGFPGGGGNAFQFAPGGGGLQGRFPGGGQGGGFPGGGFQGGGGRGGGGFPGGGGIGGGGGNRGGGGGGGNRGGGGGGRGGGS